MDDVPDKAEGAGGLTAPIISLSAGAGGQLILNDSGSLLAGTQSLLLNGNSLISNAGAGVIINGLSLGDCQTLTLSPLASSSPVLLNGAQGMAKAHAAAPLQADSGGGAAVEDGPSRLPAVVLSSSSTPASNALSVISTPLQNKAESNVDVDFILSESSSRTLSSSSSSLSPPPPALPRSLSTASVVMSTSSVSLSSQPVEYVVLASTGSQLNPGSSVVTSTTSVPPVFSLPQVVPSIQGVPASQTLQPSPGAQVSQCPQLVPVAPLTSPAPQFLSQTLNISKKQQQQQQDASSSLPSGSTTIVSVSQLSNLQIPQQGDQTSAPARCKIQVPQVLSISPPTQAVPAPPPKATGTPQIVPVSPIQTSSFPQVVPSSPSLSIPSAGVPLQILTSAPAAQAPLKVNQLRPIQTMGSPTGVTPGVQLLNSGIIQLPSTPPGTQKPLPWYFCAPLLLDLYFYCFLCLLQGTSSSAEAPTSASSRGS